MDFDKKKLIFTDKYIFESDSNKYVMMDWEREIMMRHAMAACHHGGDVLEVGFGMGISANYIQAFKPNTHTIMEIHPQILEKLHEWAKGKYNIKIIEGDWYKNLDKLKEYDGIFFDTFMDKHRPNVLIDYLKPDGIFTFFNCIQERNTLGLDCKYEIIDVNPDENGYFKYDKYYLPIYRK